LTLQKYGQDAAVFALLADGRLETPVVTAVRVDVSAQVLLLLTMVPILNWQVHDEVKMTDNFPQGS
jgi:hypothetical protein